MCGGAIAMPGVSYFERGASVPLYTWGSRRVQKPKQRHDIYYCTVCNVGVTLDKDPTKFVKYSAYYRNYQRKCKACRAAAAQTAVVADSE